MKLRLPPHIAWPLFIVALLGMSITIAVITVVLARSDGGAQIVDDYYQKAINWDETHARQAASEALGWQTNIVVGTDLADNARPVTITITDRNGTPVTQLQGTVRARRPHLSDVVAERPLQSVAQQPGVYQNTFPIDQVGLWDFEIVAEQDTLLFQTIIRKEVRF